MKYFAFVVGLLFCITISSASDVKCTPGEFWEDKWGGHCECVKEGVAICTPVSVIKVTEVKVENQWGFEEGMFCEPGKEFKIDCNTCICNEHGDGGQCTTNRCEPDVSTQSIKGGSCPRHGSMRTGVCGNYCRCNKGGKLECTRKPCQRISGYSAMSDKCKAGNFKKIGCDKCECSKDGIWLCTRLACDIVVETVMNQPK